MSLQRKRFRSLPSTFSSDVCFFSSDLHGSFDRYEKLFDAIRREKPKAVFLAGDLLPSYATGFPSLDFFHKDFIHDFLAQQLKSLKLRLGSDYPVLFVILGNDDPKYEEAAAIDLGVQGLWHYMHMRKRLWEGYTVFGYSCIPPSPFRLKDWERYDVSRYVDPGCTPPDEGLHTVPISDQTMRFATIQNDIEMLTQNEPMERAIFLSHCPPYQTDLDRAALDGKRIDHVPVDVHIGSIAIRRFVESRQPLLGLHGHVHEAARLTGHFRQRLGRTVLMNGSHDGSELSLIRFSLRNPQAATRQLL